MTQRRLLRSVGPLPLIVLIMATVSCRPTPAAVYRVPGSTVTVRVELQPMHQWLAEYHRTVSIELHGRVVSNTPLRDDTGGYLRINVYTLTPTTLLLRDYFDSYTIDLASGVTKRAEQTSVGTFLGSFDDASGVFRFIPASERREMPTEVR